MLLQRYSLNILQQDRQFTYNITLRRVPLTMLLWKHNNVFCVCFCLGRCHSQRYENTECLYSKIILLATTSQCLKEITFQPIGTLFTRYIRRLHYNKSMLVCTWPSKDVQFGYTNRHDRYVVAQFLSFYICCRKTFYDIGRN